MSSRMKDIDIPRDRNPRLYLAAFLAAGLVVAGFLGMQQPVTEEGPRSNMTESEICSRLGADIQVTSDIIYVHNSGSIDIRQIHMAWNGKESGSKKVEDLPKNETREAAWLNVENVSEIKLVSHECNNKMLDTYMRY